MEKKVQKKSSEMQASKELSSEELLEQIMSKKKAKQAKKTARRSTNNVESVQKTTLKNSNKSKTQVNEISSDELYEQIKLKKANRKKKKEASLKQQASVEETKIKPLEEQKSIHKSVSEEEEKQDLIITREINFDDKLDLNNKKTLKELRKAIEEFDRLESLEETSDSSSALPNKSKKVEEQKTEDEVSSEKKSTRVEKYSSLDAHDTVRDLPKKKKRKQSFYSFLEKKRIYLIGGCICLFLLLVSLLAFYFIFSRNQNSLEDKNEVEAPIVETEEHQKNLSSLYEDCLRRPFTEDEMSAEIQESEQALTAYLAKNYKTSVMYEDLTTSFSYSYQPSTIYYAASTIKALDALYIYTKAAEGKLDLDETMVYSSKYRWGSSKEMSKLKYGTKVSLRNLVKYAVTVSDNSAHQMLVSYIGRDTLKEFGKSLGASNTLVGADNFGNIDVSDALIYMKAIYQFIENNASLGEELKSYFVQAEQNDLELKELGILAAHKYGQYASYYHDIGIVYDSRPYVVAILTLEGRSGYEAKVQDIHAHVYALHQLYYETKEKLCETEVYGN